MVQDFIPAAASLQCARSQAVRTRAWERCAPLSNSRRRAFQTLLSCRLALTAAFHAFPCSGHTPSCHTVERVNPASLGRTFQLYS